MTNQITSTHWTVVHNKLSFLIIIIDTAYVEVNFKV